MTVLNAESKLSSAIQKHGEALAEVQRLQARLRTARVIEGSTRLAVQDANEKLARVLNEEPAP